MEYLITIYVLELENEKFYIGKTKNLKKRLNQHISGKGSAWTKQNKTIKVYKTFEYYAKNESEEEEKENLITLQMMNEKGWRIRNIIKALKHHGHFSNIQIENLEFKSREFCIYVLELENDKYFVGYTYELIKVLKKHENGKASKWTQLHKPKNLVHQETVICNFDLINMNAVDDLVIKYFRLKGIQNVRGGTYTIIDNEKHLQSVIKKVDITNH